MKRKTVANHMSKEKLKYEAPSAKFCKLSRSVQRVSSIENCEEKPSSSRATAAQLQSPTSSTQGKVLQILKELKKGQQELHDVMDNLDRRLIAIEKTLKHKMPEKDEVHAQSKMLKTVQVFATRHQQALSRITGDIEDEEYMELASQVPISSEESLRFVEDMLQNKASADAMMRLLCKLKCSKQTVDGVLRGLLADELVYHYNLEGRREKKSLLQLKSVSMIMNVFADKDKDILFEDMRVFVALSHNRFKQKKHKIKARLY